MGERRACGRHGEKLLSALKFVACAFELAPRLGYNNKDKRHARKTVIGYQENVEPEQTRSAGNAGV